MHLYTEANAIAKEALEQSEGDFDLAHDYIAQTCDGHEVVIYYRKAIQFCSDNDTSAGEEWLEDCGSIVQDGDTFGMIACRIAYATLYCSAMACLEDLNE